MFRTLWLIAWVMGLLLPCQALASNPSSDSHASPRQVQHTVESAIGYLQAESGRWERQGRCAACHHVAMPVWALSEAGRQGYAIDEAFLERTADSVLGSRRNMM